MRPPPVRHWQQCLGSQGSVFKHRRLLVLTKMVNDGVGVGDNSLHKNVQHAPQNSLQAPLDIHPRHSPSALALFILVSVLVLLLLLSLLVGGLRRARERRARSKTTVPALEGEGRRGEASHKVLYFTCTFNDSTARILHIVLIRSRSRSNSRDSGVRAAA